MLRSNDIHTNIATSTAAEAAAATQSSHLVVKTEIYNIPAVASSTPLDDLDSYSESSFTSTTTGGGTGDKLNSDHHHHQQQPLIHQQHKEATFTSFSKNNHNYIKSKNSFISQQDLLDFDDDDNDSLLVLSESDTNNTILATTTSPTNTVTDDGEGDHLNLLEEDTSFGNIDFYGEEDGEEEDDDLQTGDEIYQETDGEEEEGRYEDEIEFPQGPLDATTLHHHHHPRQLFIEQTSTIGYPNSISNSNNNSKRNNISILPSFAAKYMEVEEWRSNLTILSPPSSSSVLLATDTIASGGSLMGFEDDLEISDLDSRFNSMQLPSPSSSLILQETTVPQSECLNLGHGIHNNNALMDDEDDEDDFDFKDSKNNLFFNNSTANTGNTINTSNTVSAADAAASTIKVTTANDVNGDDDDGLFDDLEISLDDVRFNNHTLSGGEVLDAENEDVQVIDLEDTLPEDEEKDKVEKSQTFDGNVGKVVEIVESQQQEQNSTLVLSPTLNPPTPKQASPLVDKSSHVINTIKHLSNNLRRNSTSTNTIATNSKNPSFPFSKSLNTSPIRSSTAFSVSSSPSSSSSAPMWLPFTKGSSLSTSSSKSGSTSATTYNPSRRSQSASFASAVHLQNMSSQWMASLGGGGGGRSLSSSPTKRSNSNSASSSLTTSSSSSVTNPLQSSTSTNPSSLVLRRPQGISRNGSDFCSGNELDGMDDLVVETEKEKRFLVKPKQQQQRKQQKQQQQKESLKGLTKQKIVANNNVKNSISNPSSTASRKSGTTTSTTTGVVGTWSGVKKTSTNALSTSPSSSSPRPPLAKSPMTVNRSTHPAPILNHHHRQYFPHHNHHHYLQQQQQFSKPPLSSSSSSPMALLNRSTSIPSRKTTSTSLSSTTPTSRIPSPRLKKNSAPPVSVATTAQPTLIRNLNKHTKRTRVGDMVYNPDTRRWEGNEGDLKVFESPNLISCTTLQAPLSLSLPQQQSLRSSSSSSNISTSSESGGGMVFDAVLMRWVGNEDEFKDVFEEGEEEEEDCFKGIDDFEEKLDKQQPPQHHSPQVAPPLTLSTNTMTNPLFMLDEYSSSWKEAICIQESEHQLLMAGSGVSASSTTSSSSSFAKRTNNSGFCYDLR